VAELNFLFQGPVILINDSQSSTKHWNEIAPLLEGRNAGNFFRFQQHVHYIVWMPRTSELPTLADEPARVRERNSQAYHATLEDTGAVAALQPETQAAAGQVTNPNAQVDTTAMIPPFPPVHLPEDHPLGDVEITNLASQFAKHYLKDRSQTYRDVNMADIPRHLMFPEEQVHPAIHSTSKRFVLWHGLVLWYHRGAARLYVPRFTSGGLLGIPEQTSHIHLVLLAYIGFGAHARGSQTVVLVADLGARHRQIRQRVRDMPSAHDDQIDVSGRSRRTECRSD
jgi:hypothetical protein